MDILEKGRWAILHGTAGVGNKALERIIGLYRPLRLFFEAPPEEVGRFLPAAAAQSFLVRRRNLDPLLLGQEMEAEGTEIVLHGDEYYPPLLTHIPNPPQILYYRGQIGLVRGSCIAVVGSRKATEYGRKVAREFAAQLADKGFVIVSGLARGIDSQAHQGALKVNGDTISVLGCGINVVYPRENTRLYGEICLNGLVMSEFPWHSPPLPAHFPMRNRIISGLSLGVLVVEARVNSGALITADFALEQGRDVFAIPGPVSSPNSAGTNHLIQQGAKLTTCIDDIVEEYYEPGPKADAAGISQPSLPMYSVAEEKITDQMGFEKCHRDDLLRLTGLAPGDLSLALLKLELEGIVQSLPGNYYVRIG